MRRPPIKLMWLGRPRPTQRRERDVPLECCKRKTLPSLRRSPARDRWRPDRSAGRRRASGATTRGCQALSLTVRHAHRTRGRTRVTGSTYFAAASARRKACKHKWSVGWRRSTSRRTAPARLWPRVRTAVARGSRTAAAPLSRMSALPRLIITSRQRIKTSARQRRKRISDVCPWVSPWRRHPAYSSPS